jgi:hypothetical protein
MLAAMVLLAATLAASTAADTLEYVVPLGGRTHGEPRVITQGDTVLVRLQLAPAPGMQAIYRLGAN